MIRLVCLDMDGVLTKTRNFWIALHEAYGTLEEGKTLTEKHLHTDYETLVSEVIGRLWKGKDEGTFTKLISDIELQDGIVEFFAALDEVRMENGDPVPRAIITSGPFELADRIAKQFKVEYVFANQLVFRDGKITGEFRWPVGAGTHEKERIIETLCDDFSLLPTQVLYIGDSMSDIDAFKVVGVSIAFNSAPEELKAIATHAIETSDLRDVVPILRTLR